MQELGGFYYENFLKLEGDELSQESPDGAVLSGAGMEVTDHDGHTEVCRRGDSVSFDVCIVEGNHTASFSAKDKSAQHSTLRVGGRAVLWAFDMRH